MTTRDVQPWHRYWGKTNRKAGSELRYHLLAYHNLDVAACAWVLLEHDAVLRRRLAQGLGVKLAQVQPFVAALLALHDIGKFSPRFQKLTSIGELRDCTEAGEYLVKHDTLGYLLWRDVLHDTMIKEDWLGIAAIDRDADADDWWDYFDAIAQAVTGHHGTPPDYGSHAARKHFDTEAEMDALGFTREVYDFFGVQQPLVDDWTYSKHVPIARQSSWLLAGLAVLVDWIGSNAGTQGTEHFIFQLEAETLTAYWPRALKQAEEAIRRAGVLPAKPAKEATLHALFPKLNGAKPTPLQLYTQRHTIGEGPHLFILEDATGSGKTEAAVILALRLMQENGARGFYAGLPTMATANAMFRRFLATEDAKSTPQEALAYRLFADPTSASTVLAHSRRGEDNAFRSLVAADSSERYGAVQQQNGKDTEEELTGQAQCAAWLADNRKKALLAHIGVGTVDQALVGILPSKHQSLRLLGLASKVLIVDEVHAYDEYVSSLLRHLIAFQAALGGSTILLSATLTKKLREQLVHAFYDGLGQERHLVERDDFPLATHVTAEKALSETGKPEVVALSGSQRKVTVRFFQTSEEVQAHLLRDARAGRCACWIRNTVHDANTAYDVLKDEPSVEVKLFHARFALADRLVTENWVLEHFGERSTHEQRRGKILVATQVAEQSLDVDFDVLVSDLAPIDLLIQRAGRQHRHRRDADGNRTDQEEQRQPPTFGVLAPRFDLQPKAIVKQLGSADEKKAFKKLTEDVEAAAFAWYLVYAKQLFPKARFVYPHIGVQWRTAHVLHEVGEIVVPEAARALLERVYEDEHPEALSIPAPLRQASNDAFNEMKLARALAGHSALHLGGGYGSLKSGGAHWFDDRRTPTRLGEPTTTVRLARLSDGEIHPWADKGWTQSEVSIRQSTLSAEPDWVKLVKSDQKAEKTAKKKPYARAWPNDLEGRVEAAKASMRDGGRWSVLVVLHPGEETTGRWRGEALNAEGKPVNVTYSTATGLHTQAQK